MGRSKALKKMLVQGVAGENEQLTKENEKTFSVSEGETTSNDNQLEETSFSSEEETTSNDNQISSSELEKNTKKHSGGRPTNKSKGKTSRKQYSLTLLPDDYEKYLDLANADGLSFSKYIERAVNEYISNH